MEHDPAKILNVSAVPKPMIDLRRIVEYNEYICTSLGFGFNFLLIYLIIFKTNARLHVYRKIFLQNSLLDIFYNITNFITHAQVEFKQGNFFILMNGPFSYAEPPWSAIFIGIWVFALFLTVTGVPIQFIFRYALVIKLHKLKTLEYAVLFGISCFLAFLYSFCWTTVHWPHPDVTRVKSELLAADAYYYAGIPSFLTAEIWRIDLQIVFSYCYSLVAASYGIIIFTSIKVYKHIAQSSNLPAEVLDVHRQITWTLMVQAVAPLVVCLLPIVLCVTGCFLYLDVPGFGLIVTLLWSWIPLVNSLVTILAIRTYRQFCFIWVKRLRNTVYNNSVFYASPNITRNATTTGMA